MSVCASWPVGEEGGVGELGSALGRLISPSIQAGPLTTTIPSSSSAVTGGAVHSSRSVLASSPPAVDPLAHP